MSDVPKELTLLRLSAELHNLRRLAIGERSEGLAYHIDMAALYTGDLAGAPHPPVSNDPDDTRLFHILSGLRHIEERAAATDLQTLIVVLDEAIAEANAERRKLAPSNKV